MKRFTFLAAFAGMLFAAAAPASIAVTSPLYATTGTATLTNTFNFSSAKITIVAAANSKSGTGIILITPTGGSRVTKTLTCVRTGAYPGGHTILAQTSGAVPYLIAIDDRKSGTDYGVVYGPSTANFGGDCRTGLSATGPEIPAGSFPFLSGSTTTLP